MDRYDEALDRRYGPAESVEEFALKAQVANYEASGDVRVLRVNRPLSTGLIQWMLNSAWPEIYWQLYDWYLMPNGAFYGTRAACQPVSLAYNYADQSVFGVNETLEAVGPVTATIRAFGLGGEKIREETIEVTLDPAKSEPLLDLAEIESPTPVWFLDLRLADSSGAVLARNFYWLSAKPDRLDYENNLWFVTPTKSYADFTALDTLPDVELATAATLEGDKVRVHLSNPTDALAFFVELRVLDADGNSILPVLWDDNYVSILPGEDRELTARLPGEDLSGASVALMGWNLSDEVIQLR